MRSGPLAALAALPVRLALGVRIATLTASLVAGAAPAGALTTFFAQDLGDGSVPIAFPNSTAMELNFLAQLVDPSTEDFSGFDVADHGPLAIFAMGSMTGTLSDTVADGGSIRGVLDDAEDRGFATSASRFWKNETTSDASDELFRVTLDREVRGFGFYATAWSTESSPNDDATQLAVYIHRAGMADERIEIPHDHEDRPGGVFYFGLIADLPFLALSLRNDSTTDPGDRIGFDDLTVSIVPEPATAVLMLCGLLGLAAAGRRRSG